MQTELEKLKNRLFEDGTARNVSIFPGSGRGVTPEDIAREVNKSYDEIAAGLGELIE